MSSSTESNAMVVASGAGEMVAGEVAEPVVNPLVQIHALLRGRYWLAITLAVIGIAIGTPVGYKIQPPKYQSNGIIQIKPNLPRILYQSDQNAVMPMFDSFIESQVALIQGERVVPFAMNQPEWRARKRGMSPEKEGVEFRENLTVAHPRGTELILVSYKDEDAETARVAVNAVITAYQQLYGENDPDSVTSRLGVLTGRQQDLTRQLADALELVNSKAGTLGAAGVKALYDAKLEQRIRVESQLQDAELAVALAGNIIPATQPAQLKPRLEPPSVLGLRVPEIGRAQKVVRDLEQQIEMDSARLGPKHRTVIETQRKLQTAKDDLAELTDAYQQIKAENASASSPNPLLGGTRDLAQLKANLEDVKLLVKNVRAEADALGKQWTEVEHAQAAVDALKAKLDETNTRMEELRTEQGLGGRVTIDPPSKPLAPEKDKRIAFAVVGGLGLGGLGVGFVLLLGFFDHRVRHIYDVPTNRRAARMLGVLPLLPDEEADPEQAMIAAHSVHQIRMLLQQHRELTKPVYTVTSAAPGAGKTSLTLALGLSFAASGARTLIIDCDMIGGGMTAKMKKVTRRRLGHVLRRLGLINTQQLVAALKEGKRRGEKIGETLVRQGLVTAADVEHALEVQRDAVVGLREALQGDPANECVTGSGSEGLFLMPLGSAQRQHASQLSYPALRRVIDQVRSWFDVILIDTGPILGSLEASVASMASDAVVMTVARGEQRPLVERAIDHVIAAGGNVAGIVMNRARAADIVSSGFSSSTRYLSNGSLSKPPTRLPTVKHDGLKLGPIGNAVIALGSADDSADEKSK